MYHTDMFVSSYVAVLIYKCVEGREVIHCRGLASPQGLIDLIDQKEDQEEEEREGERGVLESYICESRVNGEKEDLGG